MTPRDTRLLARLQASLDTLENDAEIAAVVRQIRRIRGAGAFSGPPVRETPDDRLSLIDDRPMVTAAMRRLGHVLRIMTTAFPDHPELTRLGEALAMGAQWVPGNEARTALGCMAMLLDYMRDQMRQQHEFERQREMMKQANAHDLHALRDAMLNLSDRLNTSTSTTTWGR